jgi:hypothetical protein
MRPLGYKTLIESFIQKDILVEEFDKTYTKLFLSELEGMDRSLFSILNNLFVNVECYSPLWTSKDEMENNFKITEETLRNEAQNTLNNLNDWLLKNYM